MRARGGAQGEAQGDQGGDQGGEGEGDQDQKPSWNAGCEPAEQLEELNCLRSLIASARRGLVSPSKNISKG